jgi:hypothetical protein
MPAADQGRSSASWRILRFLTMAQRRAEPLSSTFHRRFLRLLSGLGFPGDRVDVSETDETMAISTARKGGRRYNAYARTHG